MQGQVCGALQLEYYRSVYHGSELYASEVSKARFEMGRMFIVRAS